MTRPPTASDGSSTAALTLREAASSPHAAGVSRSRQGGSRALFDGWVPCLRFALSVMFLFTAAAHFNRMRADLVRMVPLAFPRPDLLVTLTGILEIAGAIGLVLLLAALFPANAHAARARLTHRGQAVTPLLPRLALQLLFITALITAGWAPPR